MRTLAILALMLPTLSALAVTFDDGEEHFIDEANSFPFEDVLLLDSPSGGQTTLTILPGGRVGGIDASGISVINILGGRAVGIDLRDDTELNFETGEVNEIRAVGGGRFNQLGGRSQNDFLCDSCDGFFIAGGQIDSGIGTISTPGWVSGGTTNPLFAIDSELTVTGGTVTRDLIVSGDSKVRISEGILSVLNGNDTSETRIFGGLFSNARTIDVAKFTISGGSFTDGPLGSNLILAFDQSTITFHGSNFNFPLGDVVPLQTILTGTLADGSPLEINIGRASTARIVLADPIDSDNDGLVDGVDNCADDANPEQLDTDDNGTGDACNGPEDRDGDEFADPLDNCPRSPNAEQLDFDSDTRGDACDPCPTFFNPLPSQDSNFDGRPDECQCGDATGDGAITGLDIGGTALCANGAAACDSTLVDADGDGSTTALDIGGVVAVVNGDLPTIALQCQRASGV